MNPEAIEAARESLGRRLFEKDREWNRTTNGATYLAEFDFPWNKLTDKGRNYWQMQAEAALEAAAPYLIREARAAELEAAAEALAPSGTLWWGDRGVLVAEGDGALPTVTLNVWLRARAAAIRAGEA